MRLLYIKVLIPSVFIKNEILSKIYLLYHSLKQNMQILPPFLKGRLQVGKSDQKFHTPLPNYELMQWRFYKQQTIKNALKILMI
jgi:hypothetical protein